MPPTSTSLFDQFRIVDAHGVSLAERCLSSVQWLEQPGCMFQRSDVVPDSRISAEGIIKPGLFVSIVLHGAGEGGPCDRSRFRYTDDTVVIMALRKATACAGDVAAGTRQRAAILAYPQAVLERLGLNEAFFDLFEDDTSDARAVCLKRPPRLLAMASEMLASTVDDGAGRLLLSAYATEILVRAMTALAQRTGLDLPGARQTRRLQAVRDSIDADLKRRWTVPELARRAGISRRSLNVQFRRAFGMSVADYLRTKRLQTARDAIIQQGLSVTEAAFLVGYGNPANFATAFRKHFGHVPSQLRL